MKGTQFLIPIICAEDGVRNSTLWNHDMSDRSGESSLVLVLLHRGCCRRIVLSVSIVDLEAGTNLRGVRRYLQRWAFIVIPSPWHIHINIYIYIYAQISILHIGHIDILFYFFWVHESPSRLLFTMAKSSFSREKSYWHLKAMEMCWIPPPRLLDFIGLY